MKSSGLGIVETSLNNSQAALCIAAEGGSISWKNSAFKAYFPHATSLASLLETSELKKISASLEPLSFTKKLVLPSTKNEARFIISSLDISTSAPDSSLRLIGFFPASRAQEEKNDRDALLASAAHDLKNPLGAIFGYADALLETSKSGELTDRHREILSRIRATAARSVELVKNYQLLAEVDGAKDRPPSGFSNLNGITTSVIEHTWRDDHQHHTIHSLLSAQEIHVALERIPLERIIANLFVNALRYTPPGGVITVETYREGEMGVFRIQNSGVSIPEAEQAKLFTKHYRASTSTGTTGTGLGLFITKQLLHSVGGSITLESTPSLGTRFTVKLPAKS